MEMEKEEVSHVCTYSCINTLHRSDRSFHLGGGKDAKKGGREKWCARVAYKNAYEGLLWILHFLRGGGQHSNEAIDRSIYTYSSVCLGDGEVAVEDAAGQPSEREKGRSFKGSWNETFSNSQGSVRKEHQTLGQWPFQRNRVALPLISGAGRNTRVLLRGTTASLKEGFQTIRATFMCDGDHLSAASTLILKDLPRWRPDCRAARKL